ncbi:MAG: DHA2 family efflux MFS transporter permease subunit [Jatrophihabitans sp.]
MTDLLRVSSPRGRRALAATILGSSMVFLDSTIANVATKRIGQEFHASFGSLQWVLNGYMLPLASLILLGGSLGDLLGRRRVYVVGVIGFAVASALCAVAPNVGALVAARALQGLAGALLTPGSLALITSMFDEEDRGKAVGSWSGLSSVSTAIGPFVGGWLVEHVSWRWAFGINLPLAVAVLLLVSAVPESRSAAAPKRPDVLGTVLIALGLGALTFGTTSAGDGGWDAAALGTTVAGAALVVAFVLIEIHSRHPLVPPTLFADRTFSAANAMTFCTYGALSAALFVLVLHLQSSAGYGPLAAGVATLPITLLLIGLSSRAGAIAARIGPRLPLTIGPLLAAVGLLLTLRLDADHRNYLLYVLPGVILFGLGMATLVAPLTASVMASAPASEVGIASGVNNAVARSASLLTVAVLPPLAGLRGDAYEHAAAMTHGYRVVTLLCIALLVIGAMVVALSIRPAPLDTATRTEPAER